MQLGLDFGTSYTKLGLRHNGEFITLLGNEGQIPTVATYLPSQRRLCFGPLALRIDEAGAETAFFFKLALKRQASLTLGSYSLPDLLLAFFRFLQQEYLESKGIKAESLYISVPNYFGLNSRRILLEAARQAFGVKKVFLLPEPLAAALGYNLLHPLFPLQGDILSIDIGGGTSDFSFLTLAHDKREMLVETQFQIGHDAFSGSEIDQAILQHLLFPAFTIQTGLRLPREFYSGKFTSSHDRFQYNRLRQLAEKIKIELSKEEHYHLDFPDFHAGYSLKMEITAEMLASRLEPIFERLKYYIEEQVKLRAQALHLFSADKWHIDAVLLLGGASQTRGLKDFIASIFPHLKVICPEDPSFYVLRGLCHWENDGISIKSIYPFTFYIERMGPDGSSHILEKVPFDTVNLELDLEKRYPIFSLPVDSVYNLSPDPDSVLFRIYEVEEEDNKVNLERFSGQEMVWQWEGPRQELHNYLELYLDLKKSRIESGEALSATRTLPVDSNILSGLLARQKEIQKLIADSHSNPHLAEDFGEHLSRLEKVNKPYYNHSKTTLYKLLYLLDFFTHPGK
ncbi:MAG: Hsp70 family protein [Syntrophomonas sp.]|uniref:Hsp70 family protein n=1 Tax=Syntrophomonas sp. TaxID=2053627 RepID=UPI002633F1F6|nr:Hsp70 family protein [Syntrophomonas sp.]MDD3878905.1 Hsp70 family protein [Syntrophomonas sp.]MDD4626878.1 Hsp70 family protein [Syntrophomonas sp.]